MMMPSEVCTGVLRPSRFVPLHLSAQLWFPVCEKNLCKSVETIIGLVFRSASSLKVAKHSCYIFTPLIVMWLCETALGYQPDKDDSDRGGLPQWAFTHTVQMCGTAGHVREYIIGLGLKYMRCVGKCI